jgi:anti-anti-sigma factor
MSIDVTKTADGNVVTINVGENFDFAHHKEFRESYRHEPVNSNFIIEMSQAKYLDSSALGMLLMLRKYAGGDTASITLQSVPDEVKQVLEIANFHKLFKIN